MAYLSLNTRDTARDGLIGRITDYLRSEWQAIIMASIKLRQFDALWALSDSQLAERGLKRENLARDHLLLGDWT